MVQPPYSAPLPFPTADHHDRPPESAPAGAAPVEKSAKAALRAALRTGLIAGAVASVVSTLALALAGRRQAGSAVAPTNAISHWLWRGEALAVDRPTLRHTVVGYAIHHLSSTFWAVLYAWLHGNRQEAQTVPKALAGATVAAAMACLVDYKATPKRLTPGFEHRLSTGAMALVYGAFAVGLAAGCLMANKRSSP
ncbi:hypothetical protein [Variovorax sp. DT-64]|uniref:hypothetical protein n=1 Tax=Variovorax sp. DT-64 TaxID=3396160 RepID=UPI003F19BD37